MKSKFSSCILFLLYFSFNLCAQTPFVRESSFNQKVVVAEGSAAVKNASPLIRTLSAALGKPLRSTSFTIEFKQTLTILTRDPKFVYNVQSEDLRLSGDVEYRRFTIRKELMPQQVDFQLRQRQRSGVFAEFTMSSRILNGRPEPASYNAKDTLSAAVNGFELVNPVFTFGTASALDRKIKTIDAYHSHTRELEQLYVRIQSVFPYQEENFRYNLQTLSAADVFLQKSTGHGFFNELNVQAFDPENYIGKTELLRTLYLKKRGEMNLVLQTLHFAFFDKGMYHLRRSNYARAREFFTMCLEVNPVFAPALLQLAVIDFELGDLMEATCKSDDILYNLQPDSETRERTYDLLKDIHFAYIERGEIEFNRKAYRRSLDAYESARSICDKYTRVRCGEEVEKGVAAVKSAIFREMLDEARDYVILNEFDRAEELVNSAIRYQRNHPNEVPLLVEAVDLLRAVRQKRYEFTIQRARKLTDQKLFESALQAFQVGDSLLLIHELAAVKDLRASILAAARPRIFELLYEGNGRVKVNRLSDARSCYRRAIELQNKYSLSDDSEINKVAEALRSGIFNQQCLNSQASFDSLYAIGQQLELTGSYQSANAAFEAAIAVADANSECAIEKEFVENSVLTIRPAVTYLDLMDQVMTDQKTGRYQSAINHFKDAGSYFETYKVGGFGITHNPDLLVFIREKGNNGLIHYAGDYYREIEELENSLTMYRLLLARKYDERLLSGALYMLGKKTGERDRELNPGASWKDLVQEYTAEDKRMKRFSRGYKAGFKKKR